jgi:4-amino-4-deoxy-L-arabinose transferase-like glycosyltransferase
VRERLRSFPVALAAIALGAFALRILYTLLVAPRPGGSSLSSLRIGAIQGSGDSFFFHATANLMASGHGFVDPLVFLARGAEVPTALHPPLYPLILSVESKLGATSWLAHQLPSTLFGTVVVVLAGLLGRRVAGTTVGLLAAAIAALYPTLIAADGALMSEALYGLVVTLVLLLAYRHRDRRDLLSAAGLGALVGLAALTRTEALLFVPLLVLPATLRGSGRRTLRAALACVACVAVLAPWTVRNWSVFDRPLLVSSNGGTVLAGANCAQTYAGRDLGGWRFDCVSQRTSRNEAVQAGRWQREGVDYARHHSGRLPVVGAVRILRTWDLYQPRAQLAAAEGRNHRVQELGTIAYFPLAVLALYGVLVLRRAGRDIAFLLTPALAATLASVLGYGIPRFRHAAEIPLVILAAAALASLARSRRRGLATVR